MVYESVCMITSLWTKRISATSQWKHFSKLYPQDGGESQLASKWRHCHHMYSSLHFGHWLGVEEVFVLCMKSATSDKQIAGINRSTNKRLLPYQQRCKASNGRCTLLTNLRIWCSEITIDLSYRHHHHWLWQFMPAFAFKLKPFSIVLGLFVSIYTYLCISCLRWRVFTLCCL